MVSVIDNTHMPYLSVRLESKLPVNAPVTQVMLWLLESLTEEDLDVGSHFKDQLGLARVLQALEQ